MPSERLPNASFSQQLPKLQLFWDSTSLGQLKECPRKYELAIIEGWEPKGQRNVHLEFGIWMHSGRERYYHERAKGQEQQLENVATRDKVDAAVAADSPATNRDRLRDRWANGS